MQHADFGTALIHPVKPVIAGSFTTIAYTYSAGHPIDDSGYVKIVFRNVGDFGTPQFDKPAAANYCSISTAGNCFIQPRWDPKGHTRPWGKALFLKINGGYLDRGEKIEIIFGDMKGGSPGWQMQTFCEKSFEFKTLVDPIATYAFKELATSPVIEIIPGVPVKAVCIAPSQVKIGTLVTAYLKLEDRWGNPINLPQTSLHRFDTPGMTFISIRDEKSGLQADSNPIQVIHTETTSKPYWADFHGQSEETIGTNSIEDYFLFARDKALLDISAHQGNDFQVTDEFWDTINRTAKGFNEPGKFITFPGYEWSGNTPLGGDRNVYFTSENGQIARSSTDLLPGGFSKYENAPTAAELFENLKKQNLQVFSFAHVGGRYANLNMHDPAIEIAVEVHSAWGTFEWLVEDAFQRGYRIGICANSDGHKCRPGASYPGAAHFGSYGGLTCVLAERLDRERIFSALKSRHFYATTGNRALIDLQIELSDGQLAMMGDILQTEANDIVVRGNVTGTSAIESIELRNGLECVRTMRPYDEKDLSKRIKIVWSGAEVRGRARMAAWDGQLKLEGNAVEDITPVNFWHPDQLIKHKADGLVEWQSVTSGGLAGMILTLEKPSGGELLFESVQGNFRCPIDSIGLEPLEWRFGGLQKKVQLYRLPQEGYSHSFSFELPLTDLHAGDNPIYIRMTQEDGHMAWTSPVYLVQS